MRLIDANTLRAEFTGNFNDGYYTVAEIKAHIDTAPTIDAVPVVQCKDCKHFDRGRLYMCRIHGSLFQPKDANWFCADGERKEKDDA